MQVDSHNARLEMMKILIATALFPPDVAPVAVYTKELAQRLATTHEVHILAYGRFPEQVPGVAITTVSKRHPLPTRLVLFLIALMRHARHADRIVIENGASVELPALFAALLTQKPYILHRGDRTVPTSRMRVLIERVAQRYARRIIINLPTPRPERLPFAALTEETETSYERSWQAHIRELEDALAYA